MAIFEIEAEHLDVLKKVIKGLESLAPLTTKQVDDLYNASSEHAASGVLEGGISWGEALGFPEVYLNGQDQFFFHLKSTQDSLLEQVKTFSHFVSNWFSTGNHPPPYYADRICVLLRKAKLFDLEREFLAAYFKHFWSERGSVKDRKLGERAKKVGLEIPAIPSSSPWYRAEEKSWSKELGISNLSVDIKSTTAIQDNKLDLNYIFYCLQCSGKVLDVDDETDKQSAARCKKCGTLFGTWGGIKTWLSRIAKKYVQLYDL